MHRPPLLIFDADDTLWESAVFFERAEREFLDLVASLDMDVASVRDLLHTRDVERLEVTGYGARPYLDTLELVLSEVTDHPTSPRVRQVMSSIAQALLHHPIVLFPEVPSTIGRLSETRCAMKICTMGEPLHQTHKYERSGLADRFDDFVVVPRKNASVLQRMVMQTGASLSRSVMIGNSPRSDIVPALDAGLHAVHVRRPGTWTAEHTDIPADSAVHSIDSLEGLLPVMQALDLL